MRQTLLVLRRRPGLDDIEGILECAYTTNPLAAEVYVLDVSDADSPWISAAGLEPDECGWGMSATNWPGDGSRIS
ncbi:hypothetical protein VQ042_17490 [Aurantimonas sp. A2-1-M11]|uniref:hypothetical protein n=1 Tax=Aurantimonas sp. A2-1-M11 TaxID=3113712 RepID=UPI002F928BD8